MAKKTMKKINEKVIKIAKTPNGTYGLCAEGSVWVGVEGVWYPYGGEFPEVEPDE